MPDLTLHLLGAFTLSIDGKPVSGIARTRMQDLLVYLFLHRQRPSPRAVIAAALWPETSDVQALKNLRTIYARLRDLLSATDRLLAVDNQSMQWRGDALQVDVVDFEQRVARADSERRTQSPRAVEAYQSALDAYRGDLLPGDFNPWVVEARERLRHQWLDAQDALITLLVAQREYRRALSLAHDLVRADRVSEPAYMRQMEVLLGMGNRAGALSTYHDCARILADELGVDPGVPMQRLYERVLFADVLEETAVASPDPRAPSATATLAQVAVNRSRLIGREQEMTWLRQSWTAARAGAPQVALLLGEAGIGKTRLAEEFAAQVVRGGGEVIVARSFSGARIAYQSVAEWLGSPTLARYLPDVDEVWRVEASRLVPGMTAGLPNAPAPEPLTQPWQTHRFLQGMAEVLVAGCTPETPRLLVLDDAHWVDADTFAWLPLLLKTAAGRPLLLLMTVRSEDVEANEALRGLRQSLLRTGELSERTLAPLDAEETNAVATELASGTLSVDALRQLYRETEGNPLFIVEMVRSGFELSHKDGEAEKQDDRLLGDSMNLPPAIVATLRSRFAQLSEGARSLAECAAVLGREVDYRLLASVSQMDEDALLLRLDELWRRRILNERGADGYDFTHDKLRQVAYAGMTSARRRVMHRRAAEMLSAQALLAQTLSAQTRDDGPAAQIGAHFERAGELARAVQWYRRAAEEATRLYATAEAVRLYQHLLEEPLLGELSTDERYDTRIALGKGLTVLGRVHEAQAQVELAIEDAEAAGDELRLAWAKYEHSVTLGALLDDQVALAQLQEVLELFVAHQDRLGQMKTMSYIGQIQVYFGEYDEALANYARVIELAREENDPLMLGDTLAERAWLEFDQWKIDETLDLAGQALVLLESIAAKERKCWTELLLGYAHDHDTDAWRWFMRAHDTAREIENGECRVRAKGNLGLLLIKRGDYVPGLEILLAMLREAQELDFLSNVAYGAEDVGIAFAEMGMPTEAETAYRAAAAVSHSIDATFLAARVLMHLARNLLDIGQVERAVGVLDEIRSFDYVAPRQYFLPEWFEFLETRIDHARNLLTAEEADTALADLLAVRTRHELVIEIVYWRWRILPSEQNRSEAIRLLGERYEKWPHASIHRRYAELTRQLLPKPEPFPGLAQFAPDSPPLEILIERAHQAIAALEKHEDPHEEPPASQ